MRKDDEVLSDEEIWDLWIDLGGES